MAIITKKIGKATLFYNDSDPSKVIAVYTKHELVNLINYADYCSEDDRKSVTLLAGEQSHHE